MVIVDPELRGSTYENVSTAFLVAVPALDGRKLATMTIETTLFSEVISDMRVTVDGEIVEADILEQDGMMRIAFPLDSSSHKVQVVPFGVLTEQIPSAGEHPERDLNWMFVIGLAIMLLVVL